ncbi:type 1 phosphatidylinositol 4,5-bisphosphate 4-phosphatase-like [Pecten maximus]|uniref:type 1 phosphatidylinositol 4,5-bisphosphate 4-phosphatase-like n=1 Tax=Pecten maximus TaxID=6579 RepID=UPI001458EC77|nr:type 1 phosphatidylinositol 4,5-bisphosphate 4-phosphatase-like [Pecten maximus]
MADESERQPLLVNNQDPHGMGSPPAYSATPGPSGDNVTVPPIGPDELPPPYTPTAQGGIPMVNCKVCQALINIEGKTNQHVVKCTVCKEATPIKAPPPGKKYVRCPCNCLLICRSTAQRIACPRPNCRRIITLGNMISTVSVRSPGTQRIRCGHCGDIYLFNTLGSNLLARCPHCRSVSSVGPEYARRRATICFVIGLVFLGAGVGVTVGTYELASESGGIYTVWIGAFLTGLIFMIRGIYFAAMKVSNVVESAA